MKRPWTNDTSAARAVWACRRGSRFAAAAAGDVDDAAPAFWRKSREFVGAVKARRAHPRDAAPVTLGQESGAYAEALPPDKPAK